MGEIKYIKKLFRLFATGFCLRDKKIFKIAMLEQVIKSIRDFFYTRNFQEIAVPIFNKSLPLEPNIYAFKVEDYYLPTSPEATLKKAIARGIGNCFAIGHTFRDLEGESPIHKPEFLMLEWYRENAAYEDIMDECKELIHNIKTKTKTLTLDKSWPRISMEYLFAEYAKLDLKEIIDDKAISKVAAKKGYKTKEADWESLFNQIFLNEAVLPHQPFFLIDYPARISPLCVKRQDKPYLAERFELYINGIEIGNGNTENTDATEVLKMMKNEEKYRKKKGLICPPIDMEFIEALRKMRGKSYAGVGLGIERLAMALGNIDDIRLIN